MSFFDVDYNKLVPDLLPPDKRSTSLLALFRGVFQPLIRAAGQFKTYREGAKYDFYIAAVAYSKGAKVLYFNSIYESLLDNNTASPSNKTAWRLFQSNYIGSDERILFNGGKLVLEYAANKWFGTAFRQPPLRSDIYIVNNLIPLKSFVVGSREAESSAVFTLRSSEYLYDKTSDTSISNFEIKIPAVTFNSLASSNVEREAVVREFLNKYVPSGITYKVSTY